MAYEAHEILVATARARPALWRILVGSVCIMGTWIVLSLLFEASVLPAVGLSQQEDEFQAGTDPLGLVILLGSFGFAVIGVSWVLKILHARNLRSLIGPRRLAMPQAVQVLVAMSIFAVALALLPPYDMGAELQPNMPLHRWLLWLPVALIVVLIQTSTEEIVFRGYLQQALAARFKSPIVWMILPSIVFGLGHYMPQDAGDNTWLIVFSAALYGVVMADVTARAGTLGPAIAMHFANNVWALLIFASPTSLNGLSLMLVPYGMDDVQNLRPWLWVDMVMIAITWLVARVAIKA